MVEITMGGWGNSTIYRVLLAFCFYCVAAVVVMQLVYSLEYSTIIRGSFRGISGVPLHLKVFY